MSVKCVCIGKHGLKEASSRVKGVKMLEKEWCRDTERLWVGNEGVKSA